MTHAQPTRPAQFSGMIDGLERVWPFPGDEPERVSTLLEAAQLLAGEADDARAA